LRNTSLLIYAGNFAQVGGIETFLYQLMLGVSEHGVSPRLLCWGPDGALLAELQRRGFDIRRQAWRWGCRWDWPERLLVKEGLNAMAEADVVLFGKALRGDIQPELAKRKDRDGRPRFVFVTPYRPSEMWRDKTKDEVNNILRDFDAVVVQSQGFAEEIRSYGYQGKVDTLPYIPPPCSNPFPLVSSKTLRIGFLGRLAAQKNLAYLLESIAILRRTMDLKLDFFGDGTEKKNMAAATKRLGLEGIVTFHGDIPRHDIPSAIARCHLFAFTSTTEGQCLAALEILAAGRPLVATPVGVFPQLLADSRFGVLAPLHNAEAYAAALQRVAEEISSGVRIPTDIQQLYAQRFPAQETLDGYVRLLRELAA
jgi:glycosyltransferase involved in cell wall biosynthesis